MSDCLFCKIVAKTIPADLLHETETTLAFRDIHPAAPTHALVIPKRHLTSIHDAAPDDTSLLGDVLSSARNVAEKLGLGEDGYRLVINTGAHGGQSVFHLHVHVLGGRQLGWPPG